MLLWFSEARCIFQTTVANSKRRFGLSSSVDLPWVQSKKKPTHACSPAVDRSASPSSPFMELNEPNFARRGKFFCRSSGYPAMNIKPANKSRLSPPSFNAIQLLSSYLISHFTFFDHHSFSNLRAGRGREESRTSSVWDVVISGRGTNPLLARLPSLQCQYPFQTILVSY